MCPIYIEQEVLMMTASYFFGWSYSPLILLANIVALNIAVVQGTPSKEEQAEGFPVSCCLS